MLIYHLKKNQRSNIIYGLNGKTLPDKNGVQRQVTNFLCNNTAAIITVNQQHSS
jgi:hypothetical protein